MAVATVERRPDSFQRLLVPVGVVATAWFLAVYATAIGRGFIKDDFAWIAKSAVAGPRDLAALFAANTGFYRPVVSVTFALDYGLFGLHPLGYGLTNAALLLLALILIWRLAVVMKLPPTAGV